MKKWKVAWGQLKENPFRTLLLMVELLAALVAFNLFASQLSSYHSAQTLYEKIPGNPYFCPQPTLSNDSDQLANLTELFQKQYPDLEVIEQGKVATLQDITINSVDTSLYLFSQEYVDLVQYPLEQGQWLSDCAPAGQIPVVVQHRLAGSYRLGESYEVTVLYGLTLEDASGETQYEHKRIQVPIYVCGVLPNDLLILPDGMVTDRLPGMLGIDREGLLDEVNVNGSYCLAYPSSQQDVENILNLSPTAMSLEEMQANSNRIMLQNLTFPLLLAVAIVAMCLTGFLGQGLLTLMEKEKQFAVFFLCGATTKDCAAIQLWKDLFLVGLPSVGSIVVLFLLYRMGKISYFIPWIWVASVLFVFAVFGLSALPVLRGLSKRSPVAVMRRWI